MKKLLIIIILFLLLPFPLVNARELPLKLTADSYVVLDVERNEVVYEKNADKVEILASLTKMMSAYTVIQNVKNLDKKVTITEEDVYALWGFTQAGLKEGDKVTYMDLLYAMMLPSGADGAQALALHTAGTNEKFVKMMNQEAKKLGMNSSHFADSYGGDDNNTSTAREMAYFLAKCLRNKTYRKIFTTTERTLSNGLRVVNYTRSIAHYHGLDTELIKGSKSGYTPEAGLLLASIATINNRDYIVVVMKCKENKQRTTHVVESYKIYDYLKTQRFSETYLLKKGEILAKIPVENGTTSEYVVTSNKNISTYLTKDELDSLDYEFHLSSSITPDNKRGDNLGYVDIIINNKIVDTYHVYLTDDIFSYQKESKIMIICIVLMAFFVLILLCTNILTLKSSKKGVTK